MKFIPFLIPILLLVITRLIGFEGVYGQDPFEYVRFAEALNHFYTTGTDPGDFFGPYMFPALGSLLNFILPAAWSLQLISMAAFLGIIHLTKKIIQFHSPEMSEKVITAYLVVSISCSPYFLRSSILAMSDMLAAFFLFLGYFQYLQYIKTAKTNHLFWYGLAIASGIVTRYQTAFVALPLSLFLLQKVLFRRKHLALLIVAVLLSSLIFIPHFLIKSEEGLSFLQHPLFERWSVINLFKRGFTTNDGTSLFLVPNWMYVLSPLGHLGYFALGFPLLIFAVWKRILKRANWKLLLWLVIPYLIFIGGIPFQTQRFFTIVFPFIVVFMWPWFKEAVHQIASLLRLMPLIVICQLGIFTYSFNKFSKQVLLEKEVSAYLKSLPSDQHIYTCAIDVSFAFYQVKQPVKNIFYDVFENFEQGALVLVQPENLEFQWRTGNPGRNWQRIKKDRLELLKSFRKGWELYVIK